MPLADFTPDNEIKVGPGFPRFKVVKDEKARICVLEKAPEYRYVHELRAPKVENGEAVMITKERRSGEKYEDYSYEFLNSAQCFGDDTVVKERGSDPKNCIMCAAAQEFPERFNDPKRVLAIHIFKYAVNPGTHTVAHPFSGQVQVWRFNDNKFSTLVSFAQEHGDLRELDIMITTKNHAFQNFDMQPGGKGNAVWRQTDEGKRFVAAAFKEARAHAHTLEEFCGRAIKRNYVQMDITRINNTWLQITGTQGKGSGDAVASGAFAPDLAGGLDDLISQSSDTAVSSAPATTAPPVDDLDSLLGSDGPTPDGGADAPYSPPAAAPGSEVEPPLTEAQAAVVGSPEPPKPGSSGETMDFSELFGPDA